MTRLRLLLPLLTGSLFLLAMPAFAADAPPLDRGDTAWMLTSTALVLMMTVPAWRCSTPAWCAR
jgi:Amt family ammonium transporter